MASASFEPAPSAHVSVADSDSNTATLSSAPTMELQKPTIATSDVQLDASVLAIEQKLVAKKVSAKSNTQLRAAPSEENEARAKAKGWDNNAVRQARSLYDLFSRLFTEEYGFCDLAQVRPPSKSSCYSFTPAQAAAQKQNPDDRRTQGRGRTKGADGGYADAGYGTRKWTLSEGGNGEGRHGSSADGP